MKNKPTLYLIIIFTLVGIIIYLLFNNYQIRNQIKLRPGGGEGIVKVKAQTLEDRINELLIKEERMNELGAYFAAAPEEEEGPPVREITIDQAQILHNGYKNSLNLSKNISRAVAFDLKSIIDAMKTEFGMTDSDWTPSYFENRGFILYFANYGDNPDSSIIPDATNDYKNRNTAIVRLCRRNNTTSDWVLTSGGKYFDFGDVHPPKIASHQLTW